MELDQTLDLIDSESDCMNALEQLQMLSQVKKPDQQMKHLVQIRLFEYERRIHGALSPVKMIERRMQQLGISRAELARLAFKGHRGRVSDILSGQRKLNLTMVRILSAVLYIDPSFLIKAYEL